MDDKHNTEGQNKSKFKFLTTNSETRRSAKPSYLYKLNPGQLDTGQLGTGHLDTGQLGTGQLGTHESGKVGQLDTSI